MSLPELKMNDIKSNAAFLRVQGAYVQQPIPGVYGLDKESILSSNDASALYPTVEILSNIGYETLYGRVYDADIVDSIINLFKAIEKNKNKGEIVLNQAETAFLNAVGGLLKNFTSRKSVANKKTFIETNTTLMLKFFRRVSRYVLSKGSLENIFKPKTDEEYILLRSSLYPLLESIYWLSEKNKGYSELIVDYVFHFDVFIQKYKNKKIFLFTDVNSVKMQMLYLDIESLIKVFDNYFLNPYGTLFTKHKDKLAYTVQENKRGLARRKIVKNAMLCLIGIVKKFNSLTEKEINYFLNQTEDSFKLTEDQLRDIFSLVDEVPKDSDQINWRIKSLINFEFDKKFETKEELKKWLNRRISQLNGSQLGIKVTLNSGYGITGLLTFAYSNPLIANSITTCGKIYGIKLFQKVTVDVINNEYERRESAS